MVKKYEYIYILNPNDKTKLLKINIGITSYHQNIIEIINNGGCTNHQTNQLSSYISMKAGREVMRERFVISNETTRYTIFDSLIKSTDIPIPKKIIKIAMIMYLYKEHGLYFFESITRNFMFFIGEKQFEQYQKISFKKLLKPNLMANYLGLTSNSIDLKEYLRIAKYKIIKFFEIEFPFYLRFFYFNINLNIDRNDQADKVQINFEFNNLEDCPKFIRYFIGDNEYKINFYLFGKIDYKFDFHKLIEFSKFIYLLNNNIEMFREEDQIRNGTLDCIYKELYLEKRKNFCEFIKNPIPIKKLNKLQAKFSTCVITITKFLDKTIIKQQPKFLYDQQLKQIKKEEPKPVIVKLLNKEYDLNKITCKESLDVIWDLLNKGAHGGVYNILDGFVAKQLYCKILLKLNMPLKKTNI